MNNDERRLILLVTKDYQTMGILEQTFARADFRVIEAANLEQVVSAIKVQFPDIAVIDGDVEGLDREILIKHLPEILELPSLPIVFLYSGVGHIQPAKHSLDLDQYLIKPFDPIVLATLVERTLSNRQALLDSTDSMAMRDRKNLRQQVQRELHRVERHGGSTSICIFDLVLNSTDQVLRGPAPASVVFDRVAELLPDIVRASSLLSRLSRRRFMWVMPETNAKGSRQAVQRMANAIAELRTAELRSPLGIRAGVATAPEDGMDYDELVSLAEDELANNPVEFSSNSEA